MLSYSTIIFQPSELTFLFQLSNWCFYLWLFYLIIGFFLFAFQVLDEAMRDGADKNTKKGLTRVLVTRADVDIRAISDDYRNHYAIPLADKIEAKAKGSYKEFLLTLMARGN